MPFRITNGVLWEGASPHLKQVSMDVALQVRHLLIYFPKPFITEEFFLVLTEAALMVAFNLPPASFSVHVLLTVAKYQKDQHTIYKDQSLNFHQDHHSKNPDKNFASANQLLGNNKFL